MCMCAVPCFEQIRGDPGELFYQGRSPRSAVQHTCCHTQVVDVVDAVVVVVILGYFVFFTWCCLLLRCPTRINPGTSKSRAPTPRSTWACGCSAPQWKCSAPRRPSCPGRVCKCGPWCCSGGGTSGCHFERKGDAHHAPIAPSDGMEEILEV